MVGNSGFASMPPCHTQSVWALGLSNDSGSDMPTMQDSSLYGTGSYTMAQLLQNHHGVLPDAQHV